MAGDSAFSFIQEAMACLQSGQIQRALEFADRAVALEDSNAEAWLMRAIALSQLQRPGEASSAFVTALERNPSNPKIAYNYAVHLFGMGDRSAANLQCKMALSLDPDHQGARDLMQLLEPGYRPSSGYFPGDPLSPQSPPPGYAQPGPTPPNPKPYDQFAIRPGYDTRNVQSIGWIENLGQTWDTIGYILGGLNIVHMIVFLIVVGSQAATSTNPTWQTASASDAQFTEMAVFFIGLVINALLALFMIFDLSNRRGNWLWIMPIVPLSCGTVCCPLCTLCSPLSGVLTIIYIYLSRQQKGP